jgi:hypothetical protein
MKKLILFIALVSMSFYAVGQSFSLSHENGDPIAANSTLAVLGDPIPGVPVAIHIKVTNNAADTLDVLVKKVITEGDTIPGTMNYFCWGACFSPEVYVSPIVITLAAGETTSEFIGDYDVHEGEPGKSWVSYVWFDKGNPDDSVMVTVEYNASYAGIGDDLMSNAMISNAYPNPANSHVSFDYELPARVTEGHIIVTNILGVTVEDMALQSKSGKFTIATADYPQGMYFYNFIADGKMVETKKFMVKH